MDGDEKCQQDYKIQNIGRRRMTPNIFLPYTLENWLQQLHSIEMWSYDKKNDIEISQSNDIFWIFETLNQRKSRKQGTYTYMKKLEEYK